MRTAMTVPGDHHVFDFNGGNGDHHRLLCASPATGECPTELLACTAATGTARRSCCWAPTAGRRTRNTACCSAWMPPGACSPPATSPSAGAWAAWTPRARRWWTSSPASATTHCHSSPAQAPPRCLPASGTRMPWRRCASTWIPTASRRAARCGRATAGRWRPRAWRTACCWGCCPRALAAGPLPWLPSRARAAGCTCTKT
mmetsp:Transcript_29276/g.75153  ORF Transcript_29276/g.75153 Transcript_29276/m.75153 type:complete len:201 (-) Transcript_29276:245-847(-)